jgi:predicted PurR-regulated permease PerM
LSVLGVLGCLVLALWLASVTVIPMIQKQAEQFTRDLPTLLAQVQDLTINGVGISPQSVLEEGQDYLSSHVTLSSVLNCKQEHN